MRERKRKVSDPTGANSYLLYIERNNEMLEWEGGGKTWSLIG